MLSLNYKLLSREFYSGHPDGHPCYGQLTAVKKSIRSQVAPDCIADSSVQLVEVTCFFKLSAGQLFVLIDRRLRSIMKGCVKNNLLP